MKAPPKRSRLRKPAEIAVLYQVTPETVVDWARSGRIEATRTPGGQWRVYADEALMNESDPHDESGPAQAIAAPDEP